MGTKPSVIEKPLSGRSFPNRQRMNPIVDDWLALKKMNDQKRLGFDPNLWCINQKCYDLTTFLNHHPGGASWLHITQGMDCTGIFQTYHLNINHVESMLSKYYVRNIKNKPSNSQDTHQFEWNKNTSHYHKLRSKVYQTLIKNNKKHENSLFNRKWNIPNYKMHILAFTALLIWLISFYFLVSSPSLKTAFIAGFCLHPLVGIGHNFLHQADNKGFLGIETYWRYVVNLSFYDLYEFKVHHAISHHTWINLDCDLEVSALEPIMNFMTNAPTNCILIYIYGPLFYFFLPMILMLQRIIMDVIKLRFVWYHYLPVVEFVVLLYFNIGKHEYSFWGLLWLFYVMIGVKGLIVIIVSFPIHRSDYCWSEGDKNGSKDFVKHVLMSTVDYFVNVGITVGLFGFEMFNDHRIHHLFPTLDASKLEQIRPVFVEYCKENELKTEFRENSYNLAQLFVGMLRNWYRVYEL